MLTAALVAPASAQTAGGTGGGTNLQTQNPDLDGAGGAGGGFGLPGSNGQDGTNPSAGAGGGGGGGGGAGGGLGGTGGAGGTYLGGAGAAGGTAGSNGTDSSGLGNGGGGGGGGNGGNNGLTTAVANNGSALAGQAGGNGGNGGNASGAALSGGGGGGGAGGYGLIVTAATSNTNNSTITGGNGGNGGAGGSAPNGVGDGGGNGGDGGIGVLFQTTGATLNNNGTVQGGSGGSGGAGGQGLPITSGPYIGMNNGPDGTGGNGAVGIMGAGLTIINGGTIAGGTGVNGQASAIALTGGTNNYTSSASNAGLTGSISWSSGTTLILNQTTAAGAVSGAFNYSQNNQFKGSGALQITTDGGRAVIIGGSNAGFTGNTTINAGSTVSLATSNALGSGGNAGSISMLAGSTLFLNNISLPNAVNVSGDPNIEVTGINNTMATYTGSSTATTNILGFDNNPAADLLRVTTANASYSGTTVVGGSGNFAVTLQGGATNAFGSASTMQVNFGSVLDLGGSDQALASLSGNGTITNSAGGGTNTLTIQGGTSSTFGGGIQDGASATTALTVSNTNTVLTLSGTNTYSGVTTIGGGATLALSGTGSIANSSAVNLATGGIFDVSQTGSGASITTLGNTANGQTGVVALGFRSLTVTNGSSTFAGIIADGGIDNNTGGSFGVSGGTQTLTGQNTYTAATSITGGTLALSGSGSISQSSLVTIGNGSGTATFEISNTSGTSVMGLAGASDGIVTLGNNTLIVTDAQSGNQFAGAINGSGGLTISGGAQNLSGSNGYTGQTTINSGASLGLIGSGSIASSIRVLDNGALDLSVTTSGAAITTLAGTNANAHVFLDGGKTLTLTAASDTFAGNISGAGGNLILSAGYETLTGTNTYSGSTTINGGTLEVDGSIASSQTVTVNSGGTLTGTGLVDPLPATTTIMSGGIFAPGNGTPGTSMTIGGNLAFQSGAFYLVQLNPATSTFANVVGTATLGNATVGASFASGSYVAKQYTILTAGSVSGTFNPTVLSLGLPSGFHTTLSYDANHAYLDLALNFLPPPGPGQGIGGNQQGAGNAIINYFNTNGSIPLVFGGLTPQGLTQISGETAVGSQQTTFQAMGEFMGVMTDPFMNRGGDSGTSSPVSGYASTSSPTNAFAMFTKAPPPTFEQRWSVWGSGFGGSQTTSGNAAVGSNNTTSSVAGTAVGADYLFSPTTVAGFALAGGGTNFSVANGGTGRSDLFQAGAYIRHNEGPAYISAALAYGWQDITTNRTVTVAGFDQLRAEFNANAYSGRLEGGYRFASPATAGVGITPYAAAQFVTFDLPAYAERAIAGTNIFALGYGAHDATDVRSELGIRTDKSFALADGLLTLRGRFAWAHDYNADRSISPTFQSLPGASFVVNGATPAADSALTTASVEMKWRNGWSIGGTFEGEFSSVTNSYAGKGVVRYQW